MLRDAGHVSPRTEQDAWVSHMSHTQHKQELRLGAEPLYELDIASCIQTMLCNYLSVMLLCKEVSNLRKRSLACNQMLLQNYSRQA